MSRITEIFTDLYVSTHGGHLPIAIKGSDDEPDVLDFNEAAQAITDLLNEAIGEDEPIAESPARPIPDYEALHRNELRQDIRTKLGLTTKETK